MPDWQVLNARLTTFVTPDTEVPATLWRDLVGEDPENSVLQRTAATKIESGPFADGNLTLQIQPARIDWRYEPLGLSFQASPPVLGPFPKSTEPFLEFCHRWVRAAWYPSVTRLALGFILISMTPNRATGYRELEQYVDGVPDAEATDFLYQVNRPRPSVAGVDGLVVNRLSKWSVAAYTLIAVGAQLPSQVSPSQTSLLLELDLSTGADFRDVIPKDCVEPVLDDLLKGAMEIVERGVKK